MKNYVASKRFFAVAFALLVIASCCVGISYSKYVTNEPAYWNNNGKEDVSLDFTVNSVFVVNTQDALFEAINQGYSFIQLDKEIDNPLIVTQKAETLNHDLILDLNGVEIQRNGQDPILNIMPNVRLTVVDTSTEQTGGLYNPVGSVFNIQGGTLTVVTGTFESGPRYSEYYSYNNHVLANNNSYTKRTIVESEAKTVNYWEKSGENFSPKQSKFAPIIKSYPTRTGEVAYNHGNLYFDEKVTVTGSDFAIYPDTYCYYRTSENVGNATDVSMADWYYTYYVDKDTYTYVSANKPTTFAEGKTIDDYVEVTIYGYEDVIQKASQIEAKSQYYAAIQMASGTLDVQDGDFFQYFGTSNTACVNCSGGTITVKQGKFSSRVPNATGYTKNAVTDKETSSNAFGDNYFNNFKWYDGSTGYVEDSHNGRLAKKGESYCILNSSAYTDNPADVSIAKGTLYSSNNNVISMEGGKLSITDGTFTKNLTNGLVSSSGKDRKMSAISVADGILEISNADCTVKGNDTYGVLMNNGTLTVDDTTFTIDGDTSRGITMFAGTLDINNAIFTVEGNTSCGITMESGSLIVQDSTFNVKGTSPTGIHSKITSGTFNVKDSAFTITGDNAQGIYSESGTVNVNSTKFSQITVDGANAYGIKVDGGSVVSTGYVYDITGNSSMGIYASAKAQGIKVDGGFMTIDGTGTEDSRIYGINSLISGSDKFTVKNFNITMTGGEYQTGIDSENGTVKIVADTSNAISISGENGYGIHVHSGGSVASTKYSYTLNGKQSYGIMAESGTVTLSNGTIDVVSGDSCYGVYAVSTQQLGIEINDATINVGKDDKTAKIGTIQASIGVFLSSNAKNSTVQLNNVDINSLEVGVAVNGGSLNINQKGSITTQKASAIAIRGGNLTFGATTGNNQFTLKSANTTADDYKNTYELTVPVFENGNLVNTSYRNTDGIYINGGSFTSIGNLHVTHTGLQNDQLTGQTYTYSSLVVTSYALRVLGGNVNITKADIIAESGGGIYSGKSDLAGTSVGNITLGSETSTVNDITVKANGNQVGNTYDGIGTFISYGWQSTVSITGGHAIEINGGNITVFNGEYTAEFGNGVVANGDGKVTIHNGTFKGFMNTKTTALSGRSGPAAFYGLKVVGGATVIIYNGTFDGGNGGAFVTGVTKVENKVITETATASVLIYAGRFGNSSSIDSFNVYDDAKVVFGAGDANYFGSDATAQTYQDAIVTECSNAPIAVNRITQTANMKECKVYVYYGTYKGKIFYDDGNATYQTYNVQSTPQYTKCIYTASETGSFKILGNQNNTTAVFYSGN